jgi:hypothetical protein
VKLLRSAASPDKADFWESVVNWNLAIVLSQTGDLRGANATLDEAGKTIAALAERHPENAGYGRQVWVTRQARALFAGSPRSINEGDSATSLELYKQAEALHRRSFAADEANIRYRVDFIAANYGVALVTSEMDPERGLRLLEANLTLCLALPPDTLETNLSNFSVALVYRSAALTAAKLHHWNLAREYLAKARPIQDGLLTRKPHFLTRLEHASLLREMGAVEAGAGNLAVAQRHYHDSLTEFEALSDHAREIFWVWKMTEALEGLAEADPVSACRLHAQSIDAWMHWRANGGPDSTFFRSRLERATQLSRACAANQVR